MRNFSRGIEWDHSHSMKSSGNLSWSEKMGSFQKMQFSQVYWAFHGTRVVSLDSSWKITHRGLVKFIRGSKNLGKHERIAFFGADMSGRKCRWAIVERKCRCANVSPPPKISNLISFSLQYTHPFPESGKRFQALRMRVIDYPLRKTPQSDEFSSKSCMFDHFRFNTPTSSLNQGQGSVFTVRQCYRLLA